MVLTAEENALLTRVGPGTPGGELLRRYWQPVGMLPELTEETPTKSVRILGEDLVLFKDKTGRVGLLADHCSHRGASLLYGRVEERGIACAYHGWLYDIEGNVLECPAEPQGSNLHLTVRHRAYPVREYCELYWTYLGPPPAPLLPRYDLVEVGRLKAVGEVPRLDCNWLQIVENTIDQAHIFILHQSVGQRTDRAPASTTRGHIDQLIGLEYWEAPFGLRRRQVHANGYDETDLIVFPSTQRIYNQFIVKVPIDDTHTREYHVYADLGLDGPATGNGSDRLKGGVDCYTELATDAKHPPDAVHPVARYSMEKLRWQDFTVLETQGPVSDREHEHLATSDRGVVLFRSILRREIEKVQQGLDPIAVVRDGDDDLIDTYIHSYLEVVRRFPPGASRTR